MFILDISKINIGLGCELPNLSNFYYAHPLFYNIKELNFTKFPWGTYLFFNK
jgi:hypothetical protein